MTLSKSERVMLIRETGVIAVMRAQQAQGLLQAADALLEGGVRALEVTMTTEGALETIAAARSRYGGEILFGAGSVLDGETARAAILAGADFVVSPTLKQEVIAVGNRYGVPVIPGCFTATECLTAWEEGAAMIKLFPASVGGPEYVKALLAPLPQLEIVAVGGVEADTAEAYIRAGAAAVGIGSYLISQALLDAGQTEEIHKRAQALVHAVARARDTISP